MKERTLNGMPIQDVWKQLGAKFPDGDTECHLEARQEHILAEKIEKRLNSVAGMENWSFIAGEPQICRSGKSSHECCVVSGRLILYDDDRVPIVRSACGASNIVKREEVDGHDVADAVDSAVRSAFRNCAECFGIAKGVNISGGSGRTESGEEKLLKALVLEPFKALPKGGVKAKVSIAERIYELVIWDREWKELHEKYAKQFSVGAKINEINFFGVERDYKGQVQIEFVRLANNRQRGQRIA